MKPLTCMCPLSPPARLQHDVARVSSVLLRPANILRLVHVFRSSDRGTFESLLAPLVSMLDRAPALAVALAGSGLFMADLAARLSTEPRALVLKNLLHALTRILNNAPDARDLVLEYGLYVPLAKLASTAESRVLVQRIASTLLVTVKTILGKGSLTMPQGEGLSF